MDNFDIPIVLFIFKRIEKTVEIINRISEIKPKKIYLIADNGRNDEEKSKVKICREKVEKKINWQCEIIKNYSDINRGVYENIGIGAKWVLEREKKAIFLEDDNLPEISFFYFCKEMLEKYEDNNKILWICGTNYIKKYKTSDNSDYLFTRHMLPCGWATWSDKFNKYYDGELENFNELSIINIRNNYLDEKMYKYDVRRIKEEKERKYRGEKFISWDYQMAFSIRYNNLYGIVPKNNLITNIGVDNDSIHGGNSIFNTMTRRFCQLKSYPLKFPLKHPNNICLDKNFERKTNKIVIPPKPRKYKKIIRVIFKIPSDIPLLEGVLKTITFKRNEFYE